MLSGCLDVCPFSPNTELHAHNNSFSGAFNFSCFSDPVENCTTLQPDVLFGNGFCGGFCGLAACGNATCAAYASTSAEGPTIGFAEVASEMQCCAACHGYPKCAAAEWYGSTGVCIFKSAAGAIMPKGNVTLLTVAGC